jgi:hypothetical protein
MELFGPTLLRNFPLKKSDFLGIFKNILTGFYCNLIQCRNQTVSPELLQTLYIIIPPKLAE